MPPGSEGQEGAAAPTWLRELSAVEAWRQAQARQRAGRSDGTLATAEPREVSLRPEAQHVALQAARQLCCCWCCEMADVPAASVGGARGVSSCVATPWECATLLPVSLLGEH